MKLQIFTLDKPNRNNVIYPRSVVEREIRRYRKTFIKENRAMVVGKRPQKPIVNLKDVVGVIKKMTIQKDKVFVELDLLRYPPGVDKIKQGLQEGKLRLVPFGLATTTIRKDGTVTVNDDYEFIGCFVTNKPTV